ncbi:MAG: hypothetical protein GAK36_00176 [Pseudomonas sp.]|nr:MAG: hypothetical protein GAK36_00176 [Pseudomonas sp.]
MPKLSMLAIRRASSISSCLISINQHLSTYTIFLKFHFEAVSNMPQEEKAIVKALLGGMILKYQVSKYFTGNNRQVSERQQR